MTAKGNQQTSTRTRRMIVAATATAILASGLVSGQTVDQTTPRTSAAQADGRLPVRRVVLYKSGVGYFEHLGRIRGDQTVTIDFTSGQLNDVLKSLTTLDLDGGRVLGVSYNSEASLDRRLGALRLPIGQETTRAAFLGALRGARLEVRSPARVVSGRLLSVEQTERSTNNTTVVVDTVSLVTERGELQTVALEPGVNVRILDADLSEEVGRYLSLVASVRDQDLRRVSIATSGAGERDLFVSYISEVPVWKPTYRIVLPSASVGRRPLLQGWAIVDNTVGEDWTDVQLSLVAGAPQSFVQAISRPYYVQRPVVPLPERALFAPQTHQSALGAAGAGVLAGTVTDRDGSVLPGVTVAVVQRAGVVAETTTDARGRYSVTGLGPGSYEVRFQLAGFGPVSLPSVLVSGGMETVVTVTLQPGAVGEAIFRQTLPRSDRMGLPQHSPNVSIDGVSQSNLSRSGDGFFTSAVARPDAVSEVTLSSARAAQQADATGAQLGDLFEYKLKEPVTIRKNQSALVPILSGDIEAEKVSMWNAALTAGRPLRAVWVTNVTGLTLDGGTFSVTEGEAFAGEGLMESLKPGERRLLSYAIDLGMQVNARGQASPIRITKVSVNRGLVIQQTEERQELTYTARNDDTERRTLIVEHPLRAGWTVSGTIAPDESTGSWHRYRVEVAPKTTVTFTVDDVRAGQRQYAVSSITDDQIAELARGQLIDAALETALQRIVAQKAEIARLDGELAARQAEIDQIGRDQERVRENMRSLKGSSEERQLLQRYVRQLDAQEDRLVALRSERQTLTTERQKAQIELNRLIDAL